MKGSLGRIGALVRRYYYLLRGSVPRLLETIVWPSLEILIWGFISIYLSTREASVAVIGQMALAGALLWQVFVRGQAAILASFLEEMWSRNLGHLSVTPLRPWEFVAGILFISGIRMMLGVAIAAGMAVFVFASGIFNLGLVLLPYFVLLLMMSWCLGMVVMGIIVRYGMAAEWLVWPLGYLLLPFSCVFYPLSVLPEWLQPVALAVPATHLFEGIRQIMAGGTVSGLLPALALNILYLAMAAWFLHRSLDYARANALLLQQGE